MHYSVAYLFWAAYIIPGFALVMRYSPDLVRGGLLSTIAVSFLGSMALLMPVSIIGFVIGLPLEVISAFIVLAILWGVFDIVRRKAWRTLLDQSKGLLRLEAALIAGGLWLQSQIGSLMGADALIHLARVRQFLDHGLTNADPFIKGGFFYPIYHTNAFHVLLASGSQLSQVHYLDIWFGALPVFLLLICCAVYFMAYEIFESRWAGWFAATFVMIDQGHINFLTYPNKISPFFLVPILVGLTVRALREGKPTIKDAVHLGIVSLTLGMFHGMYAFFGAILVGPVFLWFAFRSWWKKEGLGRRYAWCLLALVVSMPWPVISKTVQDATRTDAIKARIARDRDPDVVQFATANTDRRHLSQDDKVKNPFFQKVGSMWMKKPFRGFGGGRGLFGLKGFRYQYLLLGFILAWFLPRRREFFIAASVSIVSLCYLLIPPLCTVLYQILEAKWMLQRLETTGLSMMCPTLVGGTVLAHLTRFFRPEQAESWRRTAGRTVLQSFISLFLLLFAFSYSGQWPSAFAWTDGSPWIKGKRCWYENYRFVDQSTPKQRQRKVRVMKRMRKFYQEKIPAGSVVIITDNMALELVSLHDCHILAPLRSSVGVPDIAYLRRLNKRVLLPETSWDVRKRILKQVGTNLYIPQRNFSFFEGRISALWGMRQGSTRLIELDLDKD